MKHDRPKPFVFFQAACTAAMRADGHGGCGLQPQLADGPSMPERRLRVGGQRVPRKSNECRLDKLFFSAGQSSALFVANCSGRTVAIRTFRRDRRSCLGSESDGPYGDTVPDCVNRGMSRRRWCQRVSSGPCGRSSPTMSRFLRISRNSWRSRWPAR
jgi:hypothetical protein